MKEIIITFRDDQTLDNSVKWCAEYGGRRAYARSKEEAIGLLVYHNAESLDIAFDEITGSREGEEDGQDRRKTQKIV